MNREFNDKEFNHSTTCQGTILLFETDWTTIKMETINNK